MTKRQAHLLAQRGAPVSLTVLGTEESTEGIRYGALWMWGGRHFKKDYSGAE